MKTLEIIQKTCKVFYVLTKIAMILFFVWAIFNAIGAVCCITWHCIGKIPGDFVEEYLIEKNGGEMEAIGVLLAEFVFSITDGILFYFANRYLKQELADGTPFTIDGSNQVKSLGIKAIVLPLVAVVISSVIYVCFDVSNKDIISNGSSVVMGIALILVALILRHGAEIKDESRK